MKDTRPDSELNRIIAEWCGWKYNGMGTVGSLHHPTNCTCFDGAGCSIPSYCTDLNAMHEAVETLRNNQVHFFGYFGSLFTVVTNGLEWGGDLEFFGFNLINATARQRAEALVRVIEEGRR